MSNFILHFNGHVITYPYWNWGIPPQMRWCITTNIPSKFREKKSKFLYLFQSIINDDIQIIFFCKFFWPYLLPWQPYKILLLYGFMKKTSFYHNPKTRTDIITIFSRVWDIYPGMISVKFSAILPQKIKSYCDFLAYVNIYHFGNSNTKHQQSKTNLHSLCIFVGYIVFRRLFLVI